MSQPSSSAGINARIPAIPAAIPDTAENTNASIETCDTNVTESNQPHSYAIAHNAHDTTSITTLTTIDATAIGNARRFTKATTARTLREGVVIHWQRDRDPMALACIIFAILAYVTFFAGLHQPDRLWLVTIECSFAYSLAGMIHYRRTAR